MYSVWEKQVRRVILVKAFKNANHVQDIFTSHFKEGRAGNEVLKLAQEQAIAEGLMPTIYTHPIGIMGMRLAQH